MTLNKLEILIPANLQKRLEQMAIARDTSIDLLIETALLIALEESEDESLGYAFSDMEDAA